MRWGMELTASWFPSQAIRSRVDQESAFTLAEGPMGGVMLDADIYIHCCMSR